MKAIVVSSVIPFMLDSTETTLIQASKVSSRAVLGGLVTSISELIDWEGPLQDVVTGAIET